MAIGLPNIDLDVFYRFAVRILNSGHNETRFAVLKRWVEASAYVLDSRHVGSQMAIDHSTHQFDLLGHVL